eukprot:319270_1
MLSVLLFALVGVEAEMKLSTCQASSMWVTYPVQRKLLQEWMYDKGNLPDAKEYVLDTPSWFGDYHPVQIEFDTFHSCKSLAGMPYPSFKEVAIQVPYVSWRNRTVHYQPWAIMDNFFGVVAGNLLCGVTVEAHHAQSSQTNGTWSQAATVSANSRTELEIHLSNGHMPQMTRSAALAQQDAAWREMVTTKKTNEVVYKSLTKYSCNTIVWDFEATSAAAVTHGELEVSHLVSGRPFFPGVAIKGDIDTIRKQFEAAGTPGFAVYAVQSKFTAYVGCK